MEDKDSASGVPRFVGRRTVRAGEVAVGGDAPGSALAPGSRVVNRTTVNNVLPEVRWPLRMGAVPPLASSFQPRPSLRALVEAARADGQDVVLAQPAESGRVLVGEGGVGKSQLAASYYLASGADLAVWTTAKGGTGQVVADFAEAAGRIRAPGADGEDERADARALLEWLQATDRSWLVVIDDVEDLDQVLDWWPCPHPRGWVLATTRQRKALAAGRTRVDVDVFTEAEAHAYLHQRAAGLPDHPGTCSDCGCSAASVASLLGRLPLALSHAAAYLDNNGDITPAAYARMLAEPGRILAEVLPGDGADGYARAVHTTMLINLDAVQAQEAHPGLARAVLDIVARLDPNGSPAALWTDPEALAALTGPGPRWWQRLSRPRTSRAIPRAIPGLRGVHADQIRACLLLLDRYSLTTHQPPGENEDLGLVRIHALTARAARDTTPEKQRHPLARRAADALLALWPDHGRDPVLQQTLRANAAAMHEVTTPALYHPDAHTVLFEAGTSLGQTGQVTAARDYYRTLTDATIHRLGPDHHDTLTARYNLAWWRGVVGDVQGAVDELAALLPDQIRVLGPDHPDTLSTRHNLAWCRGEAGDVQGAANELAALLPDRVRVLGPDHHDTLTARYNLARWRGVVGDVQGAVDELAALLSDQIRVLGPDHPDTLSTRHNLAWWRGVVGDVQGAVDEFAALLPDRIRVLGPDHPYTLSTRHNLARWRGEAGDVQGAVDELAALLTDQIRVLGPDHQNTLSNRHNLARWRGEAGHVQGAVDELAALLSDQIRVLGPDHPDTLSTRHNLAWWRGVVGDVQGAVDEFAALLPDRIRVLGPDHPSTLSTRHNLARWRGEAGDVQGAVDELAALLSDQIRVLGPDHPDALSTRHHLARWRGQAGDAASAAEA
ncbi:tetratricopeptide repeat protein [Streptomyces phaeochromogenes]|uniref:Tetratricopeptide repeat protein n=1 Tax=Streptomyces phaeochromogenes TaxID=1923 RepID=A0ABZ1HH69_STRPH|nr:tetratricopeptide repeat protein [Streptomyces phaeochromogenes]WSD16886.1 tetratricopeptide repeat protein [Streptomyces phaeochromogenes]